MNRWIYGAQALMLGMSFSVFADEPGWEKLSGTSLHSAFANMELGDGVHFTYQFRDDGSVAGIEMARHVSGNWRTTAREFCWRWTKQPDDEECLTIKRKGRSIRAYRNGTEVWSGDLTPLHDENM